MTSLPHTISPAKMRTLSNQASEILANVLREFQQGPVDAQSYRVDHEEWIEDLHTLVHQRYLILEDNAYRPSLAALTIVESEGAKTELIRCEKAFNILRAHFQHISTRNTHKKLSELATELDIEFTQTIQTTRFLLDASSLWCSGHTTTFDDPSSSSVLPGEAIIPTRSFQNLIGCMLKWLSPPPLEHLFAGSMELISATAPQSPSVALHPAPIVSSFLYELSSDAIVQIIGRAGLSLNWELTTDEQYSHKTRIRAYMPRIESALLGLENRERLLFSQNLIREILRERPDLADQLDDALAKIGWSIASGTLTSENLNLREQFFPNGAEHTAYVELRRILGLAISEIYIVDPYMDGTIFTMLKTAVKEGLRVRLLGGKLPPDFLLEATKFEKEFSGVRVEIRKCKDFHDRFIILDQKICFHLGASIKDAGGRAFMISQLEEATIVSALLAFATDKWGTSTVEL
jgi:hypothetical protein